MNYQRIERRLINFALILGVLVTVGFAVYFSLEHYGGRQWKSELQAFAVGSPFVLFPWLMLYLVARSYPSSGAVLATLLIALVGFSGWIYYEMLIASKDHSRVFAFAIVPGIQFVAAVFIWIVVALTSPSSRRAKARSADG